MRNIQDYPGDACDCYTLANWLNEAYPAYPPSVPKPHPLWNDTTEATKAAQLMKQAGWTFLTYDPVYGTEIWQKPSQGDLSNEKQT